MRTIEQVWPFFGLRVRSGPVELRGICDADLPVLADVAVAGIHDPSLMPFFFPWTDMSDDDLPLNFIQYHWRNRAEFGPARWGLLLGVWFEGRLVGCQGITTKDFLVTRTGETGSWLGKASQGRGIGTLMRQLICVLCFDHLDFVEVTSSAFTDNPASLAVSRKVGYVDNGEFRMRRRTEELAVNRQLVLTPERFVRPDEPVEVTGVAPVRALLALDR